MINKLSYPLFLCLFISFCSFAQNETKSKAVNYKVHTFYYSWYGTPEYDGKYAHWNHSVIPHYRDTSWDNAGSFPGGDDIGADFYPALGNYSSNDPEIISKHMALIKEAGIGVVSLSWWGKNSYTDKSVPLYLDLAHKYGLKVCFHLEPYYKTAVQFKTQLEYLTQSYLEHPAFYKHNGLPLYYIYDSGKVKYHEWNKLLSDEGELSVRGTELDALFIGHFERERDGSFITKSGFDGFYTYYASEGFMYGCSSENWPTMAKFAKENDLLFIPCSGPGYIDTRIRPWNDRNTESREGGLYYERMFMNAVSVNPDFIGITSFNEWHEGTQIEPAIPKTIPGYTYEDYGKDTDPMFYIKQTRALIDKFEQ